MSKLTSADPFIAFDDAYIEMFKSMKKFFRFAQDHPEWEAELNDMFKDEYYSLVAQTIKNSVDHEIKYLHKMQSL